MSELTTLGQQMERDGYWLSGYGDEPTESGLPTAASTTIPPPAPTAGSPPMPVAGAAPPPRAATGMTRPGGGMSGEMSPSAEIRTLYAAAHVLALRGDEQTCQALTAKLRDIYGQYVADLRQAGVEPSQVRSWRQQQLVLAKPVSELQGRLRLDKLVDVDVRNPRDEYLGEISDLVVDPATGQITHAIIERGGFLGIGEDRVAVPWERFKVTADMTILVLNSPVTVLKNAPKIARNLTARNLTVDPNRYGAWRQEIEQYWQQQSLN